MPSWIAKSGLASSGKIDRFRGDIKPIHALGQIEKNMKQFVCLLVAISLISNAEAKNRKRGGMSRWAK